MDQPYRIVLSADVWRDLPTDTLKEILADLRARFPQHPTAGIEAEIAARESGEVN